MKDLCVISGNDTSGLNPQICEKGKGNMKIKAFNVGLFHSKKNCIKNGYWEDGEFRCSVCGRLIALAYKTADEIHIWKLPVYKKFKVPIDNVSFIWEISEE